MTTRALIRSMRLRTLPLSTAGIVLGLMLACTSCSVPWYVIILTILTTVSLQILSNMSNELGDWLSGVDSDGRDGPTYSLGQGDLTEDELRSAIRICMLICAVLGLAMIRFSFGTVLSIEGESLVVLGALAIWAAMHYTLGRHPYGYIGLGDLFVLVFFGLIPVMGGYFVASHHIDAWTVMPGLAIGFFSVGVLNVNNIRDMKSDAGTRLTVPLIIGEKRARIYHSVLIISGWILLLAFTALRARTMWGYLFILTLPLYIRHLKGFYSLSGHDLDPMLPLLVISTFILSVLMGTGFLIH